MTENISVLIVDDEFQSRKLITKMLSLFFPEISIITEAATVNEAMLCIGQNEPGLIFLDIQLQKENGFDLLSKITNHHFELIFITAYNEFAVKAFRYNALDYLMKPVDADEFREAVKKALHKIKESKKTSLVQLELLKQQLTHPKKLPGRIVIPSAEGYLVTPIENISYCHANSNYTEFYCIDKTKIISSYTMGQYEDILIEHNFFRIHRSFMINLAHVKMYKKVDGGIVVMNDGKEIEVSRRNKDTFLKLFKG
jgi:two-component system LytT family response regulator